MESIKVQVVTHPPKNTADTIKSLCYRMKNTLTLAVHKAG